MRFIIACLAACMVLLGITGTAFASAHSSAEVTTANGLPLAPLKHAQVEPLYQHFPEIMAAAHKATNNQDWQGKERNEFNDVFAFTRNTYRNALWGYAPGDVLNSDANPWHLPTHAYLRGGYELLERLRNAHPADPDINALFTKVNNAMFGLMGTCYYSGTPFSTTDDVRPDWSRTELPPLVFQTGLFLTLLAAAVASIAVAAARNRPQPYARQLKIS